MKGKKLQKKIDKARKRVAKATAKLQKLETKQAQNAAPKVTAVDGDLVHSAVN